MKVLFTYNTRLEKLGKVLLDIGLITGLIAVILGLKWPAVTLLTICCFGRGLTWIFGKR